MKLIAKRDFRNPTGLPIELEKGSTPLFIPMGARFNLGGEKPRNQLTRQDALLVNQLAIADCISDGSDPKIIKEIDEAVAVRTRREATMAKETQRGRELAAA